MPDQEQVAPSAAADFTPPTALVTLPRPNGAGHPLVCEIRALTRAQLLEFHGGNASAGTGQSEDLSDLHPDVLKAKVAEADAKVEMVVRSGAVSPTFAFRSGDAGVLWDALVMENQKALFDAILDHSGVKLQGDAEAIATFRYVQRDGLPVRDRDRVAVPNGNTASPVAIA